MPSPYETALSTGATTLARCFKLTRLDGVVLAFTDHDDDLDALGVTFKASGALTASEAAATLGLSPDDMDASGALSDDAITEADILAGRYDGATIEVFDVDWSDPSISERLGVYTIGEIERGDLAFRAELRSLAAGLDRKVGRVIGPSCDAQVGDARCGLDLDRPDRRGSFTVASADGLDLVVDGLGSFAPGAFDRGVLTWTSGANAGLKSDVRISRAAGDGMLLAIWRDPPAPVAPGDAGEVTIGCPKTAAACRAFGNIANFRGFPHVPGESFMGEYAVPGDPSSTGGSRFE